MGGGQDIPHHAAVSAATQTQPTASEWNEGLWGLVDMGRFVDWPNLLWRRNLMLNNKAVTAFDCQ
jgi:hypothetical protein